MNRNQYLIFLSQIKWDDLKVEDLRRNIKLYGIVNARQLGAQLRV